MRSMVEGADRAAASAPSTASRSPSPRGGGLQTNPSCLGSLASSR